MPKTKQLDYWITGNTNSENTNIKFTRESAKDRLPCLDGVEFTEENVNLRRVQGDFKTFPEANTCSPHSQNTMRRCSESDSTGQDSRSSTSCTPTSKGNLYSYTGNYLPKPNLLKSCLNPFKSSGSHTFISPLSCCSSHIRHTHHSLSYLHMRAWRKKPHMHMGRIDKSHTERV